MWQPSSYKGQAVNTAAIFNLYCSPPKKVGLQSRQQRSTVQIEAGQYNLHVILWLFKFSILCLVFHYTSHSVLQYTTVFHCSGYISPVWQGVINVATKTTHSWEIKLSWPLKMSPSSSQLLSKVCNTNRNWKLSKFMRKARQ